MADLRLFNISRNSSEFISTHAANQSSSIIITSWCVIPIYTTGAVLNISVLMTFLLFPRQLINAFTIHIVHLTVIDLAYCLVLGPLYLYRNIDETWLYSAINCSFYKYASWTISNLLIWQHFIVCVDRWLAFTVPLWYREKKTVKMGIVATLSVLLFYHVWYLPLFVNDVTSQRLSATNCSTKRTAYFVVVMFLITVFPQVFIYVSNPLLLILIWRRGARRRNRIRQQETATQAAGHHHDRTITETASSDNPDQGPRRRMQLHVDDQQSTDHSTGINTATRNHRSLSGPGVPAPSNAPPTRPTPRRFGMSRNAQLVFFLTLVQIISALPGTAFSLLLTGKHPPQYAESGLLLSYALGSFLFVIDPLIYMIFLPNLRKKLLRLIPPAARHR